MNHKELVKKALIELIENKNTARAEVETYFDIRYQQNVDGKSLDFEGFLKHLQSLQQHTKEMRLKIMAMVCENNTVFTKHQVTVVKNDDKRSTIKVMAEFLIDNEKIISCDELTFVEQGDEKDKELAGIIN